MVPAQWQRSLLFLALLGELQGFDEFAEASACRLDEQGIAAGLSGSVSLDQFDEALLEFRHGVIDTVLT
jgi:hypothetical protein